MEVKGGWVYERMAMGAVCLLTAALFGFWYVKAPELAERQVTAHRFYFYGVMWVESLCGLVVAWCVRKSFRFCWLDLGICLLGGYVWLRAGVEGAAVAYRTELWLLCTVLYFLLRFVSTLSRKAVTVMLWVVLGGGCVEAVYGLAQLYGGCVSGHPLYRLTGSFFNPGPYSGFLVLVLPIALFYSLKNNRLVWGIMLLILSILPAGMSRSSWLAAVAAMGIVCLYHEPCRRLLLRGWRKLRGRSWWIVGIGGALLCVLLLGLYGMKKDSADGRLLMWKIEVRAMQEHPWIGVGLGNFGGAYGEAQADYFAGTTVREQEEKVAGAPEYGFNEYLQLGMELGMIGLLLFLGVLGMAAWQLIRSGQPEAPAVLGGLAAYAVFACFSYPLNVLPLIVVLVLFLALAGTMAGKDRVSADLHRKGRQLVVWGVAMAGFLITEEIVRDKAELRQAYVHWKEEQHYFNMNIFEETVAHYRELYPCLKDQPRFLFEYGQCLSKTGQYEEAIRILSEGVRLSADPMFYNIMGRSAQALGRYGEAETYFEQAARRVPHRLYPLYLLAKMYFESGQPEKGREMAWRVLRKEPKVMSEVVKEMKAELRECLKEK